MALVLNEEQQMLKESARGFLTEHAPVSELRKLRDERSERGYSGDLWKQMVEMGWAGILVPEAYDGLDFGHVGMGQVVEESGRTLTASPLFATAILGVSVINSAGSEAQKSSLLPAIAAGELTTALAVDEKIHHAPLQIALSAEAQGDGYVLNGQKRYVVDGHSADKLIVAARTSGAAGDAEGISLFLVDRTAPGVNVQRTMMVDNRNAALVTFDNVDVAGDALLGEAGSGGKVLAEVLDIANTYLAAELLGIASESFERSLQYLKERTQFGVLIGSFQSLQHRAAHLWSEIEMAKSVVLSTLQALDDGSAQRPALASIAKAKLCEVTELATNEAVQMHGGIGMTDEHEIGFFMKRARPAQMLFGDYAHHADRFASLSGY